VDLAALLDDTLRHREADAGGAADDGDALLGEGVAHDWIFESSIFRN
jgi:hypothetical protein